MIIGIIAAIVAIICCSIAFIINVANCDVLGTIIMLLLIFLNAFILKLNLDIHNKSQEIKTTIVKDIKEFSVDSTLTISGVDTTKTYTLTYWK